MSAVKNCKIFPKAGIDPSDPVSFVDTTTVALAKLIREVPPLRNLVPAVLNDICSLCSAFQNIVSVNGIADLTSLGKTLFSLFVLGVKQGTQVEYQAAYLLATQAVEMKVPSCKKAFASVGVTDFWAVDGFCRCFGEEVVGLEKDTVTLEKDLTTKKCGSFDDVTKSQCWETYIKPPAIFSLVEPYEAALANSMENIYASLACDIVDHIKKEAKPFEKIAKKLESEVSKDGKEDYNLIMKDIKDGDFNIPLKMNVGVPLLYKFCTHEIGLLQVTLGDK